MIWDEKITNPSQGVFNHLNRVCFPLIFLVIVALMGDEGEDLRGVDFITVASCVSFCHSLLCSSFLFCFCPSFFLLLVLSSLYSSLLLSFFLPFLFPLCPFFFGSLGILWKWCQLRYNNCSQGLVPCMIHQQVSRQVLDIIQYHYNIPTIQYLAGSWGTPRENVCLFLILNLVKDLILWDTSEGSLVVLSKLPKNTVLLN